MPEVITLSQLAASGTAGRARGKVVEYRKQWMDLRSGNQGPRPASSHWTSWDGHLSSLAPWSTSRLLGICRTGHEAWGRALGCSSGDAWSRGCAAHAVTQRSRPSRAPCVVQCVTVAMSTFFTILSLNLGFVSEVHAHEQRQCPRDAHLPLFLAAICTHSVRGSPGAQNASGPMMCG